MELALDAPATVHTAIFERAARQPLAPALEASDRSLSYAELAAWSREVAAALAALGAGPETIVAVCVDRSVELGPALLGVLASGSAYLPVDPATPPARLRELLADSGALALVSVARLSAQTHAAGAPLLLVDALPAARAIPREPTASNLAYVLYTSGSTGKPKGVLVEQRSLAAHALGMAHHYTLTPSDRVLQFASLAFDVAAEELFPTWCAGGCVVLRSEDLLRSFANLSAFLEARRISVVNLPAGLWMEWTRALVAGSALWPASVRLVIAGSERVSASSLAQWKSLVGERVRWINGYGPTETTITATVFEPRAGEFDPTAASVPIGFALPWVRAYVLDAKRLEVAPGAIGELAIGGLGVARGYLGAPQLSAERFVQDPFASEPGARLYLSGDRARRREDGALEFLGRDDDQIKLRGYRIELGEIEARLCELPGVRNAAAALREDAPGARQLIGYVTALDETALDPAELLRALGLRLPEYMLPSRIIVLEDLPRGAGGKLDRRALPSPPRQASGAAPSTPTERRLAVLWSELLGTHQLGRDDHFFRLGGHSLLAMQLVGRLAEQAQIEITPRTIFENPTLGALAAAIDAGQGDPWPPYPALRHVDRNTPVGLSASQEPVWFLLQLEPGLLAYNTQFSVRLKGPIDPDAMRRALALLVLRHEVLRTTFVEQDGVPRQVLHAAWTPQVDLIDLEREPAANRESLAAQIGAQRCARRFDVGQLPLLEWTLLRHAWNDWELVQVEHHFIHDGWSIAILLRDLSALYDDCLAGRAPTLPPPPFHYFDYAVWQREMLAGARRERLVEFWRQRLAGAPVLLSLPTARARPALQTFNGASEVLAIPPQLFQSLANLARREGFTPFQLLLAAFELLLARHSGQQDIVIATAAANRRTHELEGILGMLVNPVPIRVDCSGDPTLREFVTRVRTSALESFEHQDLPFEHIVQVVEPPRDFAHNPIFQVLFSFHDSPVPDLAMGEARGRMVYRYNGSAKFDMNLVVIPRGEQRVGRAHADEDGDTFIEWEYNTDLFDREQVVRMVGHLRTLLEGLETHFEGRCSALPMLTQPELQQLAQWNATGRPLARDRGLLDLFREQVERTPKALAALCGEQRWTYAQLAQRAEELCARLQSAGVQPGDLVGLCVERSLDMLAALLAISACGGAWLPLDPALPLERLAFVLGDAFGSSTHRCVLTQGSLLESLPEALRPEALLLDAPPARAATIATQVCAAARGEALAYVIYTSGSTGRPKGVEVTQANLVNFLDSMRKRIALAPGDVLLAVTTLSFDIAGLELLLPLCSGAAVSIATREQASDAKSLAALFEQGKVTCMQATPATWRMLIESGWKGLPGLSSLCGGEALAPDLARSLATRTRRLWNVYGPTETTIWSSIDALAADAREVTLGFPLDNTRLYVLDANRQLLPIGAPGELWIAGAGVARGYRHRPELTAERFLCDPFHTQPGERMYASGDLARRRADGRLEYLGRQDQQVKLRGFRIELGEIETLLRAHPAIAACAVDLREFAPGDQRLIAWTVLRLGAQTTQAQLREALAQQLPEYMLPSAFVSLDALPLTANGKLDRKALPGVGSRTEGSGFVAPQGELELEVARIWREVLGIERVGARDRFFDLGGHSLLAMRAISRMEQSFAVRVPARDLMLQNLAQVATAIAQRRSAPAAAAASAKPAPGSGGLLGGLRSLLGKPPKA